MRTRYLEADDVAEVANALKTPYNVIWLLMWHTGLRISDAINLEYKQISSDGKLKWKSIKTKKTATRQLPPELLLMLGRGKPSEWVFPSKRKLGEHIDRSTVWRNIKKACKKCGIDADGVGTHTARKSFAVKDFRENGLGQTMFDLQHSSASVTLLYALSDNPIPRIYDEIKALKEDLQEVYEILDTHDKILRGYSDDDAINVRFSEQKKEP